MANLTFTPRHGWVEDFDSRKRLAIRIAQIIGYTDSCPPFEQRSPGEPEESKGGWDWTLNGGNDWWLHIKQDGTVELGYRYLWKEEQWAALKTVIEMFVSKQD